MAELIAQFLKFGVVGFIAFFIDFGVMVACTELLHIDPVVSAGISFVVSVVFNYLASMRYVFTHREDISKAREFSIFVVLSLVGLAMNEAVMWFGVNELHLNYMFVKVVATGIVMLWNFFSRKRWLDAGSPDPTDDPSVPAEL